MTTLVPTLAPTWKSICDNHQDDEVPCLADYLARARWEVGDETSPPAALAALVARVDTSETLRNALEHIAASDTPQEAVSAARSSARSEADGWLTAEEAKAASKAAAEGVKSLWRELLSLLEETDFDALTA